MAISLSHLDDLVDQLVGFLRPRPRMRQLWTWWSSTPQARALCGWASIESRWRLWLEPELGDVVAGELTAEQVDRALELVELAGRSRQTANHCLVDLRRLIRAALASRRWPGPDCTAYVRRRAQEPVQRATLAFPEASELLVSSRGRYRVIFALALYLGLRKGEVLGLRRVDVDLVKLELHVRRSHGRGVTKNGKWRVLPICTELAPILESWLGPLGGAGPELLFPGRSSEGRLGVDLAISKRLRFALEGLGIEKPGIRFHDLRHSFATLAEEVGLAEEVVSQALGHCPSITGRYTHRRVDRLRQELERLRFNS